MDKLLYVVSKDCVETPFDRILQAAPDGTNAEDCEKLPDRCFVSRGWEPRKKSMQQGRCYFNKGKTIYVQFVPRFPLSPFLPPFFTLPPLPPSFPSLPPSLLPYPPSFPSLPPLPPSLPSLPPFPPLPPSLLHPPFFLLTTRLPLKTNVKIFPLQSPGASNRGRNLTSIWPMR